jgi:hypothetical protein
MGWQGILSSGEAEGAMSALRGTGFGGEAVQHYGGAQRLASDAFRNRNTMPPNTWRDYPDRARDPNRIVDPFARARAHGLPYMDDPDLR